MAQPRSVVFDEVLVTLLLEHLMTNNKEDGWARWGRLCFVNKACARVFLNYENRLVNYCFDYLYFLVRKKNRLLVEQDRKLRWYHQRYDSGLWSSDGDSEAELVDGDSEAELVDAFAQRVDDFINEF
jgi:hypothetical protein